MTELLKIAFQTVSRLPEEEQTAFARRILAELTSEEEWNKRFAEHPEVLDRMAGEAIQERKAGNTTPLDFQSRRAF